MPTRVPQSMALKAKLFRGFSDMSRLSILEALRAGPMTVSAITEKTALSRTNVSNHLRCLSDCNLVVPETQGRYTLYQLSDPRVAKLLSLFIVVAEVTGDVLAYSLALLSDAGHALTDIFALGLAWFATVQAERPANACKTFGYHRVGILAALINAITLILVTIWILFEAVQRFQHPEPIQLLFMYTFFLFRTDREAVKRMEEAEVDDGDDDDQGGHRHSRLHWKPVLLTFGGLAAMRVIPTWFHDKPSQSLPVPFI